MATPTYIPLAEITLVADALQVNFESISQDYSDLVLAIEFFGATGTSNVVITHNSDTGTNYYWVRAFGNGSSTSSSSGNTAGYLVGANATTTEAAHKTYQFLDYSATDKHKSMLLRSGRAGQSVQMVAGRWANTSAITSIIIGSQDSAFAAGSTLKLFGIHGEVV